MPALAHLLLWRLKTSTPLHEAWGPRCSFSSDERRAQLERYSCLCLLFKNITAGCHGRLWPPCIISHVHTQAGVQIGSLFSSDFSANFKMAHMMQKQSEMCLVFDFPTFFLEFWASKRWCQACASLYLFTSPILRMAQLDSSVQCSLDLTWRRAFMCDFRWHFSVATGARKKQHVNYEQKTFGFLC